MILFEEQKSFFRKELEEEKESAKRIQGIYKEKNNKAKIKYYEGVIDFIDKLLYDLK